MNYKPSSSPEQDISSCLYSFENQRPHSTFFNFDFLTSLIQEHYVNDSEQDEMPFTTEEVHAILQVIKTFDFIVTEIDPYSIILEILNSHEMDFKEAVEWMDILTVLIVRTENDNFFSDSLLWSVLAIQIDEKLVLHYLPLVSTICSKVKPSLRGRILTEDFIESCLCYIDNCTCTEFIDQLIMLFSSYVSEQYVDLFNDLNSALTETYHIHNCAFMGLQAELIKHDWYSYSFVDTIVQTFQLYSCIKSATAFIQLMISYINRCHSSECIMKYKIIPKCVNAAFENDSINMVYPHRLLLQFCSITCSYLKDDLFISLFDQKFFNYLDNLICLKDENIHRDASVLYAAIVEHHKFNLHSIISPNAFEHILLIAMDSSEQNVTTSALHLIHNYILKCGSLDAVYDEIMNIDADFFEFLKDTDDIKVASIILELFDEHIQYD